MAKILWVSDLVIETGFSRVSHSIIEFLKDDYEIVGLGINHFGDPHDKGFRIYPSSIADIYGFEKLPKVIKKENPDLIFMLNDAWIINTYLKILKEEKVTTPIIVYMPVDGVGHDPRWYTNFDIVSKVVTYTQFGKNAIKHILDDREIEVIPHGVNRNFYKIDRDIKEIRQELLGTDKYNNSFIILNANRNQPRKRLDLTMMAFKMFAADKDDVYLYLHCGMKDASIDLYKVSLFLGINDKVIFSNTNIGPTQDPIERLNLIYNATDIGVNTAWGEGWGLVNFEHLSCGKPQIASTYSSFHEVLGEGAVYVDPVLDMFVDGTNVLGKLVHPADVSVAMNLLYNDKNVYNELAQKGLEHTQKEEFNWENIAGKFDKLFKEVL